MKKGSYTIEAALLFSLLLVTMTGILHMGFYTYNRAFMKGILVETASELSMNRNNEKKIFELEKNIKTSIQNGSFSLKHIVISVEKENTQIRFTAEAKLPISEYISPVFPKKVLSVHAQFQVANKEPQDIIRGLKGFTKVFN